MYSFLELCLPSSVSVMSSSEVETPLLNGGCFLKDRWEVLRKIGGGGFGEIYKAKDHETGEVFSTDIIFHNSVLWKCTGKAQQCQILPSIFSCDQISDSYSVKFKGYLLLSP